VAVLAMVQAHILDSWTQVGERQQEPFYTLQWIGGVASALFLFLAGIALALSASSTARRHGSFAEGARKARRHGVEILILAFLFRLQAQLLGLGPMSSLLKVDMLNIMGVAMMVASIVWRSSERRPVRVAAFGIVTALVALSTPLVRAAAWPQALPDPIEAYLRPAADFAAFPFFPWAGFLFGGALVGDLVDALREGHRRHWTVHVPLLAAGMLGMIAAGAASYQPALFPTARFWHDSPTLFFIRLGAVVSLVPLAWLVERVSRFHWLAERPFRSLVVMGRSSLFVYWIHVEMVYGVIAEPLKQGMPLWATQLAWVGMTMLLYQAAIWKNRIMGHRELPRGARILAPILR
jgi:uncharacterized membrane protein